MDFKLPNLSLFDKNIDTVINCTLSLDGKDYEINGFQIVFGQPVDHKGQPQSETRGGQFTLVLTQGVDDALYTWAKMSNSLKTGEITFTSESSGTLLKINFIDAACISMSYKVNAYSGTETMMVISPSKLTLYGDIQHDNGWKI